MYKILIVKNRFPQKLAFQKCYDWFKTNANLDIVAEEMVTDFDVTTYKVGNATFNGVVCGADIIPKLQSVIPENKYNAVVFIYGNDMAGIRVSCTNTIGFLYQNTELIQLAKYDWQTLNHEMFHGFFQKANRNGANIYDNMDTYFRDNILDTNNGETSRTIALKTLAPYWNKICEISSKTMKDCKPGEKYSSITGAKCPLYGATSPATATLMPSAVLVRSKSSKHETLGTLFAVNGGATFTCKTLELPDLGNAKMISCIPKGTYTCKKFYWLKKLGWYYEVKNVPGRTAIYIHQGNYYTDYLGCIGLGSGLADLNTDGEIDITNTVATVKAFFGFMQGKDFTLTIK